ncbi:NADH-quinone oxidoreductase subunit B/C/D [Fundidesulfovibrio soli]|uniref:NADH-quinone oxidoreductase subunit B/C/D n=1 Tax=Fundidesulfovibrio soli TaxID=2922716 RepID=UPI001FAEE6D7
MSGPQDMALNGLDIVINWSRKNSLWPLFFGLSCCFVEEAAAFTSRYDIARFGSEVFRGSPRQADVLIVSGTLFKKVAPVALRLYEQMSSPKWVISMGSCSNSGGMYDVYSVVQGTDQIIPVDVYIPGCPPRPEAVFDGLLRLQEMIAAGERPARPVLGLAGGSQGGREGVLTDGVDKCRDPRGPGYAGIPVRGTPATEPWFRESRADLMWTPPAPVHEISTPELGQARSLAALFGQDAALEPASTDMPTYRVPKKRIIDVLRHLKTQSAPRYARLEDLTAVDETARRQRPENDYTLVYTLRSLEDASLLRLKVPLAGGSPQAPSVTTVWPSASWYEREVRDMFGIAFEGLANPRSLLLPPGWEGHPLRKGYQGRATAMPPFTSREARRMEPVDAGELFAGRDHAGEYLLNFGPHHYATHGVFRYVLALQGETITDMEMDIGYHHRGVEKIGERQTWHQFIPYTDRVDYLVGLANNFTYLTALEELAGVQVPERAQYIRVMLAELFRLSNHLVWFGTFVQDLGMMSPVFYAFREREQILDIVEFITGGRMHPSWFRIGGVAMDLPSGWKDMVLEFVRVFPDRLKQYHAAVTGNPIVRARTRGVGRLKLSDAVDWGVSGPNLRACGLEWDLRRTAPYGAYPDFDFDIPTDTGGDCYARYLVRMEEMRQSLRIIEQAAARMPEGRYVAGDSRYGLPENKAALKDIESLIHHFVNVTRGPRLPEGEVYRATESPRGEQGYYLVSDGGCAAYRMRLRTPGFANLQAVPLMSVGGRLADFVAVLGSIDYVLPDIDR